MSEKGLEKGIKLLGSLTDEIVSKTIEMMKIHPLIALLNHNLMANLGYAATTAAITDESDRQHFGQFRYEVGVEASMDKYQYFNTRQELIADVFRENAAKSGQLLGAETAGKLFSSFSMDKLIKLINP